MDRKQRFALFLAALDDAPAAHDRASARALLAETLNRIEDAHSGVPFDPANWMTDGRMYPPLDDNKKLSPLSGTAVFHTKGHRVWLGDNGAIRFEIRRGPGKGHIDLDKPGADGRPCASI